MIESSNRFFENKLVPSTLRRLAALLVTALLCAVLAGCIRSTHRVQVSLSTAKLQTATLVQLVERINQEAAKIKTLNATVDISASTGGQKKGKVTDYTDIRGYVLVRKPDMLRVIGLVPLVRNRLFDMVSDGNGFQLLIPPKNKLVEGKNEVTNPSANPLENLRPEVFFDSLLLHEIHPDEIPFLRVGNQQVRDPKTGKMVTQPNYFVAVLRKKPENPNEWYLSRAIYFNRENLQLYEQQVLDESGQTVTQANYSDFAAFEGVLFPSMIDIQRPLEEYEIHLAIEKLSVNQNLTDDQFALKIPTGTQVQTLE